MNPLYNERINNLKFYVIDAHTKEEMEKLYEEFQTALIKQSQHRDVSILDIQSNICMKCKSYCMFIIYEENYDEVGRGIRYARGAPSE